MLEAELAAEATARQQAVDGAAAQAAAAVAEAQANIAQEV